jgi:hypothetical protein
LPILDLPVAEASGQRLADISGHIADGVARLSGGRVADPAFDPDLGSIGPAFPLLALPEVTLEKPIQDR